MKTLIFTLSLILQFSLIQSQNFVWTKSCGGNYGDVGESIVNDAHGNLYVTGYFTDTAYFNNIQAIAQPAQINSDIFLSKYDPNGSLIWMKQAGGTGTQISNDVAISGDGVYIGGIFYGGSSTFGSHTLNSPSGSTSFVAKYDSIGNCLWAKQAFSAKTNGISSICGNTDGSINVTGFFEDSLTLTGNSNSVILNCGQNSTNIFVAKYDLVGELIWAKTAGTMCQVGNNAIDNILAKSI